MHTVSAMRRRSTGDRMSLAEMRAKLAGPWRENPTAPIVKIRSGPVLVVGNRRHGLAAVHPGVVDLPVYGSAGVILFRLEVEVLVDTERLRVRRGRQTIIPLPDGPEPTATVIQRQAQLGTAWRQAVELLTTADHPKVHAAMAVANAGRRVVDAAAEHRIAAGVTERGRVTGLSSRVVNEQIRQALSEHRGEAVSRDTARRRKSQALAPQR